MSRDPSVYVCHDCGAKEGEIHELGCDMEICPFCGNQLLSCGCYEAHNLTEKQMGRWEEILNIKGRWPYIQYPIVCAKCGKLWPNLFMVADSEWERYIQPDMRDKVICRECYDNIKELIDGAENDRR